MEGYIAEIRLFAGNFAPQYWAFCQGQILQITQNSALYSLLGITYGGNGSTTFALPDLRGRVAVGPSSTYALGHMGGAENTTLTQGQMPMHTHVLGCNNGSADQSAPVGTVLATEAGQGIQIYTNGAVNAAMNPASIQAAGASQPFSNMQPFLAMNYIICLYGIYPTRGE